MPNCRWCGNSMEDSDVYCRQCGKRTQPSPKYHSSQPIVLLERPKEPLDKLCCELAYSGTLFWAPLLLCPKKADARYHANQGLWILILAVGACTGIRLLSALNDFLVGGMAGIAFGGIYSLAFIVFLFLMLFLLWNATTRAMAVHRDEEPVTILFFDRVPLIR